MTELGKLKRAAAGCAISAGGTEKLGNGQQHYNQTVRQQILETGSSSRFHFKVLTEGDAMIN